MRVLSSKFSETEKQKQQKVSLFDFFFRIKSLLKTWLYNNNEKLRKYIILAKNIIKFIFGSVFSLIKVSHELYGK